MWPLNHNHFKPQPLVVSGEVAEEKENLISKGNGVKSPRNWPSYRPPNRMRGSPVLLKSKRRLPSAISDNKVTLSDKKVTFRYGHYQVLK